MSSKTTIRFGVKDQKLIHWYNKCRHSGIKNISRIIVLVIEYHELTGRYIEIAKIKLPEHKEEKPVNLCMYIADNSFIYGWFLKNHVGFQSAIRNILNTSITAIPNDCVCDELLISCEQLEAFMANIRSRYALINNNIDALTTGPPGFSIAAINSGQFNSDKAEVEKNDISTNIIINNSDTEPAMSEENLLSYVSDSDNVLENCLGDFGKQFKY